MSFDKDVVKEEITIEDVYSLLEDFEADPQMFDGYIVSKTICHNGVGEGSHKLYYYHNTALFRCFTHCQDTFDIFELVSKIKDIDLNTSIFYIVNYFNLQHKIDEVEEESLTEDWKLFKKWSNLDSIVVNNDKLELATIDGSIIDNYPQPRILDWEDEYITKEVCDHMNIHYDPIEGGILIPHYDQYGRLVGVRIRTLIEENEKWGKYRPAKIDGKLRNHPLGFNLYGLDKAKERIGEIGVAIVTESEKGVLQIQNYLGVKNNIAVSMCGSTLSNYQFQLLLDAGAKEICICIDRDFHSIYDDEYEKILTKMEKMYVKYSPSCNISFMFDSRGLTGYKCSPTDCGKEIFLELWKNRLIPNV